MIRLTRSVLGRMQFTLHATRRTRHGASRLVQANVCLWLVKTRRAPSRHSRDTRVYSHATTAMHNTPRPPALWWLAPCSSRRRASLLRRSSYCRTVIQHHSRSSRLSRHLHMKTKTRQRGSARTLLQRALNPKRFSLVRCFPCSVPRSTKRSWGRGRLAERLRFSS